MSLSKRAHEGYLFVDHRGGPGVPDALVVAAGLPPGAGRGVFETATYTCSHCQAVVVLNPKRTRERGYCRGCDHYICDACEVVRVQTRRCRTFNQIIDETLAAAEKQTEAQAPSILLRA